MALTGIAKTLLGTLQSPLMITTTLLMSLGLYKLEWPPNTKVENGACYDYIIIGSGAGAVVANRLTELDDASVLLIEAGKQPSVESYLPGIFVVLQNSYQDWNFKSEQELASQSQSDEVFKVSAGLNLGGSSQTNHLLYLRGDKSDFNSWAKITNDPSWEYENVLPYFIKAETTDDSEVMNSEYAKFHGTDGPMIITREPHEKSDKYFASFEEVGHEHKLDLNGINSTGYSEPFLYIGNNVRQGTPEAYIRPIKDRNNLHIMYETLATKINFDENKNAVSVNVVVGDETITIKACKEIIICAGVFNTPKLLMLSGIGPKDHLESFDIPLVQDLPVGQNLQDHVAVQIVQKMEASLEISELPTLTTISFPIFVGNARVNKNLDYPEYQSTNLILTHDTPYLILVCAQIFGYKNEICEELNNRSIGRNILYSLIAILQPNSTGSVTLRSTDPNDDPIIQCGYYKNPSDLDAMVEAIVDFYKVHNTTYFREENSESVNLTFDDCEGDFTSTDYIRCYAKHMSTSLYHYTSTCAMGKVVDSQMNVIGVNRLRVVGAPIMPDITKANPLATTIMIAEKASDMIKAVRENEECLCSKNEDSIEQNESKNLLERLFNF